MLTTILAAIVLFGLLFAGMAIGVILSNKPVKGSCGGLGAVGLGGECGVCGGDRSRCREENGVQPERKVSDATHTP
ncbi:MAG: (Na+)-NQR maturation NqrM [Aquisalimonadaceae bacterium]